MDYLRLQVFYDYDLMVKKRSQSTGRKQRSDAQRNRELILEVAKEAFTLSGANASLDDIARDAGVGALCTATFRRAMRRSRRSIALR